MDSGDRKRKRQLESLLSDEDSEEDIVEEICKTKKSKGKLKELQIDDQIKLIGDKLKKKHDTSFTQMQYRIWGEMIWKLDHQKLE